MTEAEGLLRLTCAAVFGAIIGLEREDRDKPAGVRTFSIVAMGSALFSVLSILTFGINDAGARIPAQVVTGVGFLGAGTILHTRGNVVGLTTAAGIWGAAAVGMGFGFGLFILSAGGTAIMLGLLRVIGRLEVRRGTAGAHPGARSGTTGTPTSIKDDDGSEPDRGQRG